jgi:hypothetical protein
VSAGWWPQLTRNQHRALSSEVAYALQPLALLSRRLSGVLRAVNSALFPHAAHTTMRHEPSRENNALQMLRASRCCGGVYSPLLVSDSFL